MSSHCRATQLTLLTSSPNYVGALRPLSSWFSHKYCALFAFRMRSLKLSSGLVAVTLLLLSFDAVYGFVVLQQHYTRFHPGALSTDTSSASPSSAVDSLHSHRDIANLRYRELKRHLQKYGETNLAGTTADLRRRLRGYVFPGEVCVADLNGVEMCGSEDFVNVRLLGSCRNCSCRYLTYILSESTSKHGDRLCR